MDRNAIYNKMSMLSLVEIDVPMDNIDDIFLLCADHEKMAPIYARLALNVEEVAVAQGHEETPILIMKEDGSYMPMSAFEFLAASSLAENDYVKAYVAHPKLGAQEGLDSILKDTLWPRRYEQTVDYEARLPEDGHAHIRIRQDNKEQVTGVIMYASFTGRHYSLFCGIDGVSMALDDSARSATHEQRAQDIQLMECTLLNMGLCVELGFLNDQVEGEKQ